MASKICDVNAYPCTWPVGWARTPTHRRRPSNYRTKFVKSRDDIVSQLKLLGAKEIIVSTNIPLRRDGLPLAATSEPEDPSVAVYWTERLGNKVIACDQWTKVRENMRAVGIAIGALRQIERTGATQVIERVFTGFAALPADTVPKKRQWREVFGYGVASEWAPPTDLDFEEVRRRHRQLLLARHPDTSTGSREAFDELTLAFADAAKEFGR